MERHMLFFFLSWSYLIEWWGFTISKHKHRAEGRREKLISSLFGFWLFWGSKKWIQRSLTLLLLFPKSLLLGWVYSQRQPLLLVWILIFSFSTGKLLGLSSYCPPPFISKGKSNYFITLFIFLFFSLFIMVGKCNQN